LSLCAEKIVLYKRFVLMIAQSQNWKRTVLFTSLIRFDENVLD